MVSAVFERSNAPATVRLVLAAIGHRAHDDGTGAWPSVVTLADETGLARSTVQRSMREAQRLGELVVRERPGRSSLLALTCLTAKPRRVKGGRGEYRGGPHTAAGGQHPAAQTVPEPSIEPSVVDDVHVEKTEDAPSRTARGVIAVRSPRGAMSADPEAEALEVAGSLRCLEGQPWWPFDLASDRSLLLSVLAAHPSLALAEDVRRFVEFNNRRGSEELRNPQGCLKGWLAKNHGSATVKAERLCEHPGCRARGYGTPSRCWPHHEKPGERSFGMDATASTGTQGPYADTDAGVPATPESDEMNGQSSVARGPRVGGFRQIGAAIGVYTTDLSPGDSQGAEA